MEGKKEKLNETLKLNSLIRRLGMEEYTILPDGTPITRFEQLARLIWDHALGFTQTDPKTSKETIHFPNKSFMSMIYERMEGKVPMAQMEEDSSKASLADRVSNQTKSRLNVLAEDS